MAKKYISKYTGPEIDSGLDNIPKLEGKLTELESNLYNIRFIGDDNNYVSKSVNLVPNRTYEIYIVKDWKFSIQNNKFRVSYYINGVRTDEIVTSEVKSSYTIKATECDNNQYTISVRADKGEQVFLLIEDVTDVMNLQSKQIVYTLVGDTSYYRRSDNGYNVYIDNIRFLFSSGETLYKSQILFELTESQRYLIFNFETNEIELSSSWANQNYVVLLEYNDGIVGGLLYDNFTSKGNYEPLATATSLVFDKHTISWETLTLKIEGKTYSFSNFSQEIPVTNALVFRGVSKTIELVASLRDIFNGDVVLLYRRAEGFIAGILLPYYLQHQIEEVGTKNEFLAICEGFYANGEIVEWDSLRLRFADKTIEIPKSKWSVPTSNILVYRESLDSCMVLASISAWKATDVVLLYNRAPYGFISGILLPYYQQFSKINEHKNDAELNVFRKASQMLNLRWTPKRDVMANEGLHLAGVETTSIPYSSAKEKMKLVGRDVSLHTFMTAVNNEHSLLYTEKIGADNSQSAYGIVYNGTNCISYFGNVCSAFVGTALGIDEPMNSWEVLSKTKEWEKLDNVYELEVGDVLHEPGHCSIVTNIERTEKGAIRYIYLSEQAAFSINNACVTQRYAIKTFDERRINNSGTLLRYKGLNKNVVFHNDAFSLAEGENLYDSKDVVFIDDKYYRCRVANRDSAFDIEKWYEIQKHDATKAYVLGDWCYHMRNGYNYVYRLVVPSTLGQFRREDWQEYKPLEWSAYPYVYNDDIVTFAGDRATFITNDLVYINYSKGNYTHMEIYKDEVLIKTLPLDDHYQMNISSYVSEFGMYKCRLSSSTQKSRFTYFEVLDTALNVIKDGDYYKVEFGSQNATPIQIQCISQTYGHHCSFNIPEDSTSMMFNPAAAKQAESFGADYEGESFVRLIVQGVYGNIGSKAISIGQFATLPYTKVVRDGEIINFGEVIESQSIILDGNKGKFMFSMFAEIEGIKIDVILSQGQMFWANRLPEFLEPGARYQVSVIDGIGNVTIAY